MASSLRRDMEESLGRLPGARGGGDDDDLRGSRERRSRLRDSAAYKDPKLDSPSRLSKSLGLLKSQRRPQREPKRKPEVGLATVEVARSTVRLVARARKGVGAGVEREHAAVEVLVSAVAAVRAYRCRVPWHCDAL